MSHGSSTHEQCATRCPVSRLVHSLGRRASVITWKISTQDPGITIPGSQLTGLVRLSFNRKVDFCCVELRCQELCKGSQPGLCNEAPSSTATFYALPLTSPIFQSSRAHTQNFTPPHLPQSLPQHLHTPFSVLNELLVSK